MLCAAPVAETVHAAHYGQCRYELQVLSCDRLLSVLRWFQEDSKSDPVPVLPDNLRPWEELSWCGSAVIQGFTYLTANTARALGNAKPLHDSQPAYLTSDPQT